VLQEFGFSHVALFPPSFGEARTSQRRAGIGIRIQEEEGGLRVIRVFPESPAEAAGILIGDLIFNADGNPIRRVTDLAGEKGESSVIKVLRRDEEIEIEVTRGEYKSILPETLTWKNRTAIIEIPTFDVGYNAKRIDELMEEAMSAEMIVLDLRSNGGGRVVNLQHLMGWFLDRTEEPMGTFIGRSAVNRYKRNNEVETIDLIEVADATRAKVRAGRRDGKNFEGAIAVLQSGATGSASEMAAAALQHYRGAAIIGTQSAGAVLASMIIPLPDGSDYWVQFPVTDYVTIAGDRLEGSGIKPDIAAAPPTYDKDEGIERALEWLAIIKTVRNLDR
jgi:carboxyl-terminal processing protease